MKTLLRVLVAVILSSITTASSTSGGCTDRDADKCTGLHSCADSADGQYAERSRNADVHVNADGHYDRNADCDRDGNVDGNTKWEESFTGPDSQYCLRCSIQCLLLC